MFYYEDDANVPVDVTHAVVDPFVTTIPQSTFSFHDRLRKMELPTALETIESYAFSCCYSLRKLNNLSTSNLSRIGSGAFKECERLAEIDLPDSLREIGPLAFKGSGVRSLRISPQVTRIDTNAFAECNFLFSLEFPKSLERMATDESGLLVESVPAMRQLRNVAIPITCRLVKDYFNITDWKGRSDLEKVFPSQDNGLIVWQLQRRFVYPQYLPIHKLCYYQSYRSTKHTLQKIRRVLNPTVSFLHKKSKVSYTQQDCLGMTPLHILCCSKKQNIELQRYLIDLHPESLITKDKWDAIPLLYAFWSDASSDVIELLVDSHLTFFPDCELDWAGMVKTLFKANLPWTFIKEVLFLQQTLFADHDVDWERTVTELGEIDEFETTGIKYRRDHDDTYRCLFKFAFGKRLNSLGVRTLLEDIDYLIEDLSWAKIIRKDCIELVCTKLILYEQVHDATWLLELALWRANINQTTREGGGKFVNKDLSRITCGADVIIPNVLSFLIEELWTPIPISWCDPSISYVSNE